ncbi:holocytochrome c synthase [Scheffersomyces spartinae]|uniref:Holocytochrome c-type synthase n=1 Tax=Scheffersomyces spartinae TaxID=45513 RepID=A0A9P8AJA0_9ASCO|nr:holocytochrome c synthase [Scheffersomyces spartinae]KAG7195238.1 holocytochrome c synthase [Scheffersomyces spartinae]
MDKSEALDAASLKNSASFFGNTKETPSSSSCPVRLSSTTACPVDHGKKQVTESATCPVNYGKGISAGNADEDLNPLNNMPMAISSEKAPGQRIALPTERTISTIPKGESNDMGTWEYPSPQQMLNAMLRKGKGNGIDEEAVVSMVEVHNFLNEGAWQQILEWEDKYTKDTKVEPRLLRFTGRPNDLSPKASMYYYLSKVFPQTFSSDLPFDRHDWTVLRSSGRNGDWKQVRYVIDYYSAPDDEETGMPAFLLVTRPALDSPTACWDRFSHWSYPLYKRAMGEFDDL